MSTIKNKVIALITATFATVLASAADIADTDSCTLLRPVNSIYSAEVGSASILDTYLTPIRYTGIYARIGYERMQAMKFAPEKWIMTLGAGVSYANVENRVRNRTMHSLMVDFAWGMLHRWSVTPSLKIAAGGGASFDGGVIYNAANSNNPVSAKINFSVNPMAMAVYNTRIGRLPITFRYQATIPMMGVFFSPDYGESFYEIYVGNRDNLTHFGWWGNRFDMINTVSADLRLGNTVIRLGYRNTIENSWVCNINTQMRTHTFTIGIGGDWISISPDFNPSARCRIISALY